MAYSASGLSRLAGDSNGNLWQYSTTDAIGTVNNSGYFNSAANMLKVRDVIIVKDTNTPSTNHVTVTFEHWFSCRRIRWYSYSRNRW